MLSSIGLVPFWQFRKLTSQGQTLVVLTLLVSVHTYMTRGLLC